LLVTHGPAIAWSYGTGNQADLIPRPKADKVRCQNLGLPARTGLESGSIFDNPVGG
jgi:hypothetical protein